MPVQRDEKIWVAIVSRGDGHPDITVYDNEADANNYQIEMQARYSDAESSVYVRQTNLNRRSGSAPLYDTPWGALLVDIKTDFVEGLMEDIVPLDEIKPGAAEQFVQESVDEVRKRILKRIEKIIRDETKEELLIHDEWHDYRDMED
jgi:hypothetical protein